MKIDTRHLENFGEEVCAAYSVVASFKWDESFICTRPGCGHTKYYEGKTPYSRRCLKCKRDESATARTVFEKLRMSLPACLVLVRIIMENTDRQKIEELTEILKGHNYDGVNTKSVWALLMKVYKVMNQSSLVFDSNVLFTVIVRKPQLIVILKGRANGNIMTYVKSINDETEIHKLVEQYSNETTKTAIYFIRYLNSDKEKVVHRELSYRPVFRIGLDTALKLAKDFIPWINYPQPYLYKRNGNSFENLMVLLTKDYK